MSNIIDKFRAALIDLEYDIAELDDAIRCKMKRRY